MKSTQVYRRSRGASYDVCEGNSKLDDDICSLNSWSDEIGSRQSGSSLDSSNRLDLGYQPEQNYSCARYHCYDDKNTSSRGSSKNQGPPKNGKGSFSVATSNDKSAQQTKSADRRNSRGKVRNYDQTVNYSSQNSFPLSSDFKSASFIYPSLLENPQSSVSNTTQRTTKYEDQQPVIKSIDVFRQQLYPSKPEELSSQSASSSAQRLYPDLDDLVNETDDEIMYPNPGIQDQDSFSSSKLSPSRPQFFDFNRVNHKSRNKESNETQIQTSTSSFVVLPRGVSSSPIKRNPDLMMQNLTGRHTSQTIPSSKSLSHSYFKSQPLISNQQKSELSLKTTNSSSDLESMNKQMWEHRLEPENVKAKMMSVWNNIKYGWTFKSKSNIKLDSPLFLLGKVYHKRNEDDEEPEFLNDFASRIWLTYRSNFYPIPGTKFSTDCGWGCMLRSAQMLMAQCFITHFLGREWRIQDQQNVTQYSYYKEILRWFSDPVEAPSDTIPFCLHHLVNFGRHYHKAPGDWYGPASVAYIFRDALSRASLSIPILKNICIYVAQDCTVYLDDVNRLCRTRPKTGSDIGNMSDDGLQHANTSVNTETTASQYLSPDGNSSWCRSLIIFIPVRLGGEVMNEIYTPCIKSLLSYSKCMGIIGGKPKHSLYFVGWQDDKLIYLDPHYCREAVDTSDRDFSIESFHCTSPRKLSVSKMDPSCTVGFYIKDADEFEKFVHDVTEFVSPPKQKGLYPLFVFANGSQEDAELAQGQMGVEQGRVKVTHYFIDQNGDRQRTVTQESEDFIML